MKLLRFLERRLDAPPPKSALHKWIRSGQVRVNGGRAKPFQLLVAGDAVRIPPFATARPLDSELDSQEHSPADRPSVAFPATGSIPVDALRSPSGPDLPVLAGTPALLVLAKPSGLPCQPGSGHEDSVSTRLARAFSGQAFIPAPAHRLDRDTSGLVLAGRSHESQQALHHLFRHGGIRKEYLAWVAGEWPWPQPCLLVDTLRPARDGHGMERMGVCPGGRTLRLSPAADDPAGDLSLEGEDKALSIVAPVQDLPPRQEERPSGPNPGPSGATLLLVLLLTGRKHQIRAQLSSRSCPIIGDRRYGGPPFSRLLLHACAIGLPDTDDADSPFPQTRKEYFLMPDWPEAFMPDAAALNAARARLRQAGRLIPRTALLPVQQQ